MTARDPLLQFLLRLPSGPRLSVLGYHRVLLKPDALRPGEPTCGEFEQRMRWVKRNFTVLSLSEAARALREDRLPARALSITFDDGYADNYQLALPILERLGLPATFFVSTGYLDGGAMFNDIVTEALREAPAGSLDLDDLGLGRHPLAFEEQRAQAIERILARLRYVEPRRRHEVALAIAQRARAQVPTNLMMSSAQVAALHRAGMEIGAHTVTHPILARVPGAQARAEVSASRARLEEITGAGVTLFAYPNGKPLRDYGAEQIAMAREAGFVAAVSTAPGAARPGDDVMQIPRFTPWDRGNWRFGLRLAHSRSAGSYASA